MSAFEEKRINELPSSVHWTFTSFNSYCRISSDRYNKEIFPYLSSSSYNYNVYVRIEKKLEEWLETGLTTRKSKEVESGSNKWKVVEVEMDDTKCAIFQVTDDTGSFKLLIKESRHIKIYDFEKKINKIIELAAHVIKIEEEIYLAPKEDGINLPWRIIDNKDFFKYRDGYYED